MTDEDEELARRTEVTTQYMDSLYQLTKQQLQEEVNDLYLHCFMLSDCIERLKREVTKLIAKEGE